MIESLWRSLSATSAPEALAVLLGIAYVLLILKRNRLGWIAGGMSSAIYVVLAARARLPMQSALQAYYVAMAIYGWMNWSRVAQQGGGISRWPIARHGVAVLVIVVLSAASAHFLARETHAAWPYLDSFTTWTSLFATWLVARMKLENWLYWMAADTIMVFLFAAQGYAATAGLFLSYSIIAVFGFFEWRRKYRAQPA